MIKPGHRPLQAGVFLFGCFHSPNQHQRADESRDLMHASTLSISAVGSNRATTFPSRSTTNLVVAGASATDLLRWFNFLLEYTFAYEEEMRQRYRLSECYLSRSSVDRDIF